MKKILFYISICMGLCACNRASEIPESTIQESFVADTTSFMEKYTDFVTKNDVKREALVYLDEDEIPELLILRDGKYKLYTVNDSEINEIEMPFDYIEAYAYGPRHDVEDADGLVYVWFEYVPYKGLIRVHDGDNGKRSDYYLRYEDGMLKVDLEVRSEDYMWSTYDGEKEISNEDFLSLLSDLEYDQLQPCAYLYKSVKEAYDNINAVSDAKKLLKDFENGVIDAVDHVENIREIPEEGFVDISYMDYVANITAGEESWWETEYIDFDNDGEDEMILHGYAGACLFFDVIGDTVYKVLQTGGTSDVASIVEMDGDRVVERTDLLHGERELYEIMRYDSCCQLVDWFCLYAEYSGANYTREDLFEYRNHSITMEEYEAIVDSIHVL